SVAHLYANRALAVIMTGMGSDGVRGLRLMKQQGAKILAQDAASCVVFGMPMEAIKAGGVDTVVPLEQLAATIIQHVGRREWHDGGNHPAPRSRCVRPLHLWAVWHPGGSEQSLFAGEPARALA